MYKVAVRNRKDTMRIAACVVRNKKDKQRYNVPTLIYIGILAIKPFFVVVPEKIFNLANGNKLPLSGVFIHV